MIQYRRKGLIVWFNDCILGKSGQIAIPIIVMVDPVPYYSIRARLCLWICKRRNYSQFAINRYSQLKLDLRYGTATNINFNNW